MWNFCLIGMQIEESYSNQEFKELVANFILYRYHSDFIKHGGHHVIDNTKLPNISTKEFVKHVASKIQKRPRKYTRRSNQKKCTFPDCNKQIMIRHVKAHTRWHKKTEDIDYKNIECSVCQLVFDNKCTQDKHFKSMHHLDSINRHNKASNQ